MTNPKDWEDKKSYVETEIINILKLYVENYLLDSEKGFKTLEEQKNRLNILNSGTCEIVKDASEYLGISTNEIIGMIRQCLDEEEINPEIKENFSEEYNLLRQALKGLEQKDQIDR